MLDVVVREIAQIAQQQIVVLRSLVAGAQSAEAAQAVASIARQMIDVIDAREQHLVIGGLEEEADRAQLGVGDDFIGVDELAMRMIADSLRDRLDGAGRERVVMIEQGDPCTARLIDPGVRRLRDAAVRLVAQDADIGGAVVSREPGLRRRRPRSVVAQDQLGRSGRLAAERGQERVEINRRRVVNRDDEGHERAVPQQAWLDRRQRPFTETNDLGEMLRRFGRGTTFSTFRRRAVECDLGDRHVGGAVALGQGQEPAQLMRAPGAPRPVPEPGFAAARIDPDPANVSRRRDGDRISASARVIQTDGLGLLEAAAAVDIDFGIERLVQGLQEDHHVARPPQPEAIREARVVGDGRVVASARLHDARARLPDE